MASPSKAAIKSVEHLVGYLKATKTLRFSQPLYGTDDTWFFSCDSDYAGNAEPQNKRRSQNGYEATWGEAPILWGSKASSVAFACEDIGEAHADKSSGAAEIYAAANATDEFLHLRYILEEMGIGIPAPFELHLDNTTAEAFLNDTVVRSKLKHIDARQWWVKMLRDKSIVVPSHINTDANPADMYTKILQPAVFEKHRDRVLQPRHTSH